MDARDSLLWSAATAHVVLAALCAFALALALPPITGVHPALKPLKFAISIALLLATLAYVVPLVSLGATARTGFTWLIVIVMIVEMTIIIGQAMRGVPSHFNARTPLDGLLFNVMGVAIGLSTLALIALAVVATLRPLAVDPMLALAIRIGLWMLLLVAISGFAMGGRLQHTVGGEDGGAGLPGANWSRDHGDLRVPHFFALHGLQALPIAALVIARLPVPDRARWVVFLAASVGWLALAIGTLLQAFAGRSFRV